MSIEYSTVTEDQLVLRQRVLLILFKNFGEGKYSNQSIYECADDWCSKQVTTSGLVNYYKAYYTGEKWHNKGIISLISHEPLKNDDATTQLLKSNRCTKIEWID